MSAQPEPVHLRTDGARLIAVFPHRSQLFGDRLATYTLDPNNGGYKNGKWNFTHATDTRGSRDCTSQEAESCLPKLSKALGVPMELQPHYPSHADTECGQYPHRLFQEVCAWVGHVEPWYVKHGNEYTGTLVTIHHNRRGGYVTIHLQEETHRRLARRKGCFALNAAQLSVEGLMRVILHDHVENLWGYEYRNKKSTVFVDVKGKDHLYREDWEAGQNDYYSNYTHIPLFYRLINQRHAMLYYSVSTALFN
jgi:hypothetical protein